MAMGSTARATLKGVNDKIGAMMGGTPSSRTYYLFNDGTAASTVKLFIAAADDSMMMQFPAVYAGNQSFAASCCGGGSAASLSVPKYATGVADLSFDTELYDGFWNQEGNHRSDPPNSDLKQYRMNAGMGYRFAKDWQTSVSLPFIWNDNSYSGTSLQTNGLGDTTLSLQYELLDDNSNWKVRAEQQAPAKQKARFFSGSFFLHTDQTGCLAGGQEITFFVATTTNTENKLFTIQ